MSIPRNAIETPEVIWATPDDTLQQVRDQLENPEIQNKWQAYVLIRSDDGQYAVVSVLDLRPIVWQEGPPALARPLRDFVPFQFQPGVERDAMAAKAAQKLADRNGGWLVVLQSGQYVGLVRGARQALRPSLQPNDAFDLFDQPLPDAVLAQTEFVAATIHTTVAQVASDLKSKRDPKNSYILIQINDGAFLIVESRALDDQAQQADGDLWSLSLGDLVPHLCGAEARVLERRMAGLEQAQRLAKDNFVVLIDGGKPIGLLAQPAIRRAASPFDTPPLGESVYDLFNVPQELLTNYPKESDVGHPKEPRFVNLWFEDACQQTLERRQPLAVGQPYHLALNVGLLREHSLVDWQRTPEGPQAIVEPQHKDAYLYVSLFSQDFSVAEPTKSLLLPKDGDSEPARFQVIPLRASQGTELARLEVCLYYRAYLVQTFEVQAEIVVTGEAARSSQPQIAQLTHARTASFPRMEGLPPRELSLTITRDGTDRYRFTFLVDPDSDGEAAAARAVELACSVRLTRDELTHLITKARRQLYNVVRAFDLLQGQDTQTYQKATRALAQVGRQLYLKLFESNSAQALKDWMETSLPDGSTIQVVDLAGDFVFPWSLVYTAQPWNDEEPIGVDKFWGWRYKLVILTSTLLDTYGQVETEIGVDEPLRISVGMYEGLVGAAAQKEFFTSLQALSGNRIVSEILTSRQDMGRALTAADRDLYYFFCHGYTERIATDIQLDGDLLSHFAQLAAGMPNPESGPLREHLDDLFDVSDSWLRLTQGKIPLAMLKEIVPGQFSHHPVVFMNMCGSAQVLPSLSDGFVPFFIRRGARAVIGTECTMNTAFADDLSRAFLTRFFQGEAAGDILLALRRQYLDQGNPLALAYTLYCDADLRLAEPLLPTQQPVPVGKVQGKPEQQSLRDGIEVLWANDMDGLLLTLAARAQAQEEGIAQDVLQRWDPPDEAFAADVEAGPEWTAKMVALGQRWWSKLEPKLYTLLCDTSNTEHYELLEALQDGIKALAIALAPALVTQVSALPAVAIVVATIAAKKVAESGLETACEAWTEAIAKENAAGPEESEGAGKDGSPGETGGPGEDPGPVVATAAGKVDATAQGKAAEQRRS